jgi:hypothetical protein
MMQSKSDTLLANGSRAGFIATRSIEKSTFHCKIKDSELSREIVVKDLRRVLGIDGDLGRAASVGKRSREENGMSNALRRDGRPWIISGRLLDHGGIGKSGINDGNLDSLVLHSFKERSGESSHTMLRSSV